MTGERLGPHEAYRGASTDRGLTFALNKAEGYPVLGALEMVSLTLDDLQGKILDVGMGGGRSLRQAVTLGKDYYGVDILPLVVVSELPEAKRQNVLSMQQRFREVQGMYPDRVATADFCQLAIPYQGNEFDVVFSAGALPGYSRDALEAVTSIVNMLHVAKGKVAINNGWDSSQNPDGIIGMGPGTEEVRFHFNMKGFLDQLQRYGISYDLVPGLAQFSMLTNIHLDVSQKDSDFATIRAALTRQADQFVVY